MWTSGRTLESPDPYKLLSVTRYLPAQYEAGTVVGMGPLGDLQKLDFNPISPFQNAYEYMLARFFHDSKTSLTNIDRFFKADLPTRAGPKTQKVYFRSGHTCRKKMRAMVDLPEWQRGTMDCHLQKDGSFYYRDLEDTVRYLVKQRAYAEHLVFTPSREFDSSGDRIYTEMHTGDW